LPEPFGVKEKEKEKVKIKESHVNDRRQYFHEAEHAWGAGAADAW
jgi:hypothetical protein